MNDLRAALEAAAAKLTFAAVVDILAVATLIYLFVANIRGRRAARIAAGVVMLVAVYLIAQRFQLQLLTAMMSTLAPYTVFALIVLFQSEIRRALARIVPRSLPGFSARLEQLESADEIVLALDYLAQHRVGALIVVERDIGLRTFIETGVALDSKLCRDLLISIFYPGSPLHDGAAIVQGDRVAAAACFLPLTLNPQIVSTFGTRHRAAIGVTEETDSLALVVSEETGRISYAINGELHSGVSLDEVEEQLTGRRLSAGRASRRNVAQPAAPKRQAVER